MIFTPLFLLMPFWALSLVRRFPGFGTVVVAIIALHLVVYGRWYQ